MNKRFSLPVRAAVILAVISAFSSLLFLPFLQRNSAAYAETVYGVNLVKNGDFSTYSSSSLFTNVDSWTLSEEMDYDVSSGAVFLSGASGNIKNSSKITVNKGGYRLSFKTWGGGATFTVSLNGTETEVSEKAVSDGTEKVLSARFDINVSGGTDIVTLTIAAETASVEKVYIDDVSLVAIEKSVVETEIGASIRYNSAESGLRFCGRADKAVYDDHVQALGAENVETGIMIIPTDLLSGVSDFTAEAFKTESVKPLFIAAEKWNNTDTAKEDGYYGFNCVITDISPENTDRPFSARAYLKWVSNGVAKYDYAEYNESEHSRSVYGVASAAINDLTDETARSVANEYISKITKYDLTADKDLIQVGSSSSYTATVTGVKKGVMRITHEMKADGYFTVKCGSETLAYKDGCYLVPEDNCTLEITYTFSESSSLVGTKLGNVTLKIYAN